MDPLQLVPDTDLTGLVNPSDRTERRDRLSKPFIIVDILGYKLYWERDVLDGKSLLLFRYETEMLTDSLTCTARVSCKVCSLHSGSETT